MTAPRPDSSLDEIRREIDSIDNAILDLIVKRFAATGRVAAAKANDGSLAVSPFRPAREAKLLRRLIARGEGQISTEFLVRLWRVILSFSTQSQAAVTIHTGPEERNEGEFRVRLAEHFCGMSVIRHRTVEEALQTLHGRMGDLAVIPASADWPHCLGSSHDGNAKVIGRLPDQTGSRDALIFGHADSAETGDDETIILTQWSLTDGLRSGCRWSVTQSGWSAVALPGFLDEEDSRVAEIQSADSKARIIGRYPTPIEIRP